MNQNSAISVCNGYVSLLKKAEEDKAFLIAHKKSIPKDKFDILLTNADRDIAFALSKLQYVTSFIEAPQLPMIQPDLKLEVPEIKLDKTPEITPPPIPENSPSDNSSLWALGGVVAGLVFVPFVFEWIARDPKNNGQTVINVLKAMSKASGYVSR